MKKIHHPVISTILFFMFFFMMSHPVDVNAATQILYPEITTPSDGCVFLGIRGSYKTDTDYVLKRINQIRKEACEEGLTNLNTGEPLTMADYHPVKWSSSLERLARIRAAEICVTYTHIRTDGTPWYNFFDDPVSACHENIAWSDSIPDFIKAMYLEKENLISNKGESGHYFGLIDPDINYIAIGLFDQFAGSTGCCYLGSAIEYTTDETHLAPVDDCIQLLNVGKSYICGNLTVDDVALDINHPYADLNHFYYSVSIPVNLLPEAPAEDETTINLLVMDGKMTTNSSNVSLVNTTSDFIKKLNVSQCGSFTLKLTGLGRSNTKTINLKHYYEYKITKRANCGGSGIKTGTCKYCGNKLTKTYSISGKHNYSKWKTTKKATIYSAGLRIKICKKCEKQKKETISKIIKTYTLKRKQTKKLNLYIPKGDSIKSIKSSNKKIVSVSKSGKVTAKRKGSVTIKVTLKSGLNAKIKIKVK